MACSLFLHPIALLPLFLFTIPSFIPISTFIPGSRELFTLIHPSSLINPLSVLTSWHHLLYWSAPSSSIHPQLLNSAPLSSFIFYMTLHILGIILLFIHSLSSTWSVHYPSIHAYVPAIYPSSSPPPHYSSNPFLICKSAFSRTAPYLRHFLLLAGKASHFPNCFPKFSTQIFHLFSKTDLQILNCKWICICQCVFSKLLSVCVSIECV